MLSGFPQENKGPNTIKDEVLQKALFFFFFFFFLSSVLVA
jgi:hypothetical protein